MHDMWRGGKMIPGKFIVGAGVQGRTEHNEARSRSSQGPGTVLVLGKGKQKNWDGEGQTAKDLLEHAKQAWLLSWMQGRGDKGSEICLGQ